MAYIQKANVVLRVKDSEVEYYLNLGYNLIDEQGKIIREAIPNDIHVLQKHFIESKKTIDDLKKEVVELKAKLAAKTEEVKTETVEKPTRGRKTKE